MLPFPTMIEFGLPRRRRGPGLPGEDEYSADNAANGGSYYDLIGAMAPQQGGVSTILDQAKKAQPLPPLNFDDRTTLPEPLRSPETVPYADLLKNSYAAKNPDAFAAPPPPTPPTPPAPVNPIAATMNAPPVTPPAAPRPFRRTFDNSVGGISDRVTYDMLEMPDGSIQYAGTGREADQAPFVFDAGQSNMGQQNAELAAWQAANARTQAMNDPRTISALMLEKERNKGQLDSENERSKGYMQSKREEMAGAAYMKMILEGQGEVAAKAAYDALMGLGKMPTAPAPAPSVPGGAPPLNPIAASTIDQDTAAILSQPGDYNVGRGETLLKNFGNYKNSAQRRSAIKALLANRPNLDQIGDMIMLTAANKFLLGQTGRTSTPNDYGMEQTGLPFGIDFKGGIPGLGIQLGTPEVFTGSRRISLPYSLRPRAGWVTSNEDLRNAEALKPILADFFAELQAAGYGR